MAVIPKELEKECREKLKAYMDKARSTYAVAKGAEVHPQTITNFLNKKSSLTLSSWDKINPYMENNPLD